MSPRCTFLLTLAGVLLAGLPLPWLTRVAETPAVQPEPQKPVAEEPVYATLRCTGNPSRIVLRYGGGELLSVAAADLPWEGELMLPRGQRSAELEVEAAWETPGEQAMTLTLEPAGLPECSCTRWSDAGEGTMHDIFTFVW